MEDRMVQFTREEMQKIHDASMEILTETGICFNEPGALEIFRQHGKRVNGNVVFLEETDVTKAVETAPSRFVIHARNPENDVVIGDDNLVLAPGYGAPFVVTPEGDQRPALMEDYDNFCKLVQTSEYLDMNGFLMVQPSDLTPDTTHLDMMFSNIILCDKAFMGSPVSRQAAIDTLEMAGIAWGGKKNLLDRPVMISLISSLSPLQFSEEMTASLIEFARFGQPCMVAALVIAGSSGPVTMAGVLALQNAEIMAGNTLAQLVNPGTPMVYGSSSSPMDMRSGALSIGAPECCQIVSATAQMARFYGLPSRSGGSLTDAQFPDMQAGIESTLILSTAAGAGVNFVLHACGILGSYASMSFEKFIVDEELCGMVKKLLNRVDVTDDAIDLDTIREVGIGGEYLTHEKTFERCRTEYFLPLLANRNPYDDWLREGKLRIDQRAAQVLRARLTDYEKPHIDPETERALSDYVSQRKSA